MTKIEITDEMIERGLNAWTVGDELAVTVRKILTAALSPKPEPEIEVSEGMERAGVTAGLDYEAACPAFPTRWPYAIVRAIYRAMEKARRDELMSAVDRMFPIRDIPPRFGQHAQGGAPEGAKSAPQGVNAAAPVKETGGGVVRRSVRLFEGGWLHRRENDPEAATHGPEVLHPHRRKDDPK